MFVVSVDPDKCTGCGECAASCPAQVFEVGDIAEVTDNECLGCETCITICPTGAVSLSEY